MPLVYISDKEIGVNLGSKYIEPYANLAKEKIYEAVATLCSHIATY